MKYTIRGKGAVTLRTSDFVTAGGEAQVYKKGSTVFKIYHNAADMIPDGKIQQLQQISASNVTVPKDVLLDAKGTRVGFTMAYVPDTEPLCKLFTNTYIAQHDVQNNTIVDLIKHMQETIHTIHDAQCVQVDGNELNYLVDTKAHSTCYFIDVNAYQTSAYPATVIMPSIRDYSATAFTELTDWYSFAVIACQMLVGVHPFKGKHPKFKRHALEERMRANVSIFNKSVRLPKSVRDFSRIPANYMDWFVSLFEHGDRVAPPSTTGAVAPKVVYTVVTSTNNFDITEVQQFDDSVLFHSNVNGISLTRTKKSVYIGTNSYAVSKNVYAVHTPMKAVPIFAAIEAGVLVIKSNSKRYTTVTNSNISADELMAVGNTLYVKQGDKFIETKLIETADTVGIVNNVVWNISDKSSFLYKNMIVQDVLGAKYLSFPEPTKLTTVRCSALDDYTVIDGKHENNVTVLSVCHKLTRQYGLLVICGMQDIEKHMRFIDTASYCAVNFTVLDNGVAILLYDDKMEAFMNTPSSMHKVKVIKDTQLSSDMTLCSRGARARFFTGTTLYNISMK